MSGFRQSTAASASSPNEALNQLRKWRLVPSYSILSSHLTEREALCSEEAQCLKWEWSRGSTSESTRRSGISLRKSISTSAAAFISSASESNPTGCKAGHSASSSHVGKGKIKYRRLKMRFTGICIGITIRRYAETEERI